MNDSVVEFPLEKKLELRLQRGLKEINDLTEVQMELMAALNEVERTLDDKQVDYDKDLSRFCRVKGAENVPVMYLEYGLRNIVMDADGEVRYEEKEPEVP